MFMKFVFFSKHINFLTACVNIPDPALVTAFDTDWERNEISIVDILKYCLEKYFYGKYY